MKYAKITSGVVEQVQPNSAPGFVKVPEDTTPGMLDNGDGTFSNPPIPVKVPHTVTRFQALAALHNAGLLDTVRAMMADAATDPIVVLAWENGQAFDRASPTIAAMAGALGLTDADLDALFMAAEKISI